MALLVLALAVALTELEREPPDRATASLTRAGRCSWR